MDLKTYLRSLGSDEKLDFAKRCGCTLQHLRFVAYAAKNCSECLSVAIDRESGGAVPVSVLLPAFAKSLHDAGYVRANVTQKAVNEKAA